MRKVILMALASALTLALTAGIASAERGLASSPSANTLTLPALELEGGLGTPVRCGVTMAVTLHASVAKTAGALAGNANITVGTGRCTNGDAGLLVRGARTTTGGPYHVQYTGFTGRLPSITSVGLQVVGVEFWIQLSSPRVECLTNGAQTIAGTTTGGNPATGIDVRAANVGLRGGILCLFATGAMNGVGTLATATTITLL